MPVRGWDKDGLDKHFCRVAFICLFGSACLSFMTDQQAKPSNLASYIVGTIAVCYNNLKQNNLLIELLSRLLLYFVLEPPMVIHKETEQTSLSAAMASQCTSMGQGCIVPLK